MKSRSAAWVIVMLIVSYIVFSKTRFGQIVQAMFQTQRGIITRWHQRDVLQQPHLGGWVLSGCSLVVSCWGLLWSSILTWVSGRFSGDLPQ
ncbi:MAG: hypothetical protein CM1200mP41_21910 [Gammaproteobacteria bacterium]|nr:MAG: hypothetical protein CM1200mP41_21910 [Gammaproteobacteria bacterium]